MLPSDPLMLPTTAITSLRAHGDCAAVSFAIAVAGRSAVRELRSRQAKHASSTPAQAHVARIPWCSKEPRPVLPSTPIPNESSRITRYLRRSATATISLRRHA